MAAILLFHADGIGHVKFEENSLNSDYRKLKSVSTMLAAEMREMLVEPD